MRSLFYALCLTILPLFFLANIAHGQAEVEPWGNITGIRRHGQLFEMGSSLRVSDKNGINISVTAQEKQQPKYSRIGVQQIILTRVDSVYFKETITDIGAGKIKVEVIAKSINFANLAKAYFCITIPFNNDKSATVKLKGNRKTDLSDMFNGGANDYLNTTASEIKFSSKNTSLDVTLDKASQILVKSDSPDRTHNMVLYIPLQIGKIGNVDSVERQFVIKVSGTVDRSPVNINLNANSQGRLFAGLGGNFRLQNPKTDPQVIDYSLENLRVSWGRVEMPWRFWQPDIETDPKTVAEAGKLHPSVQNAMLMAQRLSKMNIPIILSAWSPPSWAIVGKPNFRPVNGVWGNPLDRDHMTQIYQSITSYILYLKQHLGVEVQLFSFNESDLGINIRLTPEEHDEFIKGLGAYFAAKGLNTKMLLGDNSDATTYEFIYPAMADPAARPYIGAISFHSWRGWSTDILEKWADAAQKLNVPLIVGEGSTDAAAWNYPLIFNEQIYALKEINLYTRLLAICQPLSILQWQLTADYSPLAGGGIFGDNGPLRPTRRFWNLQQLASTPKNLYAMPITCDGQNVTCAALGDNSSGIYVLHIVNNGATRKVTLSGLPLKVNKGKVYVTNNDLHNKIYKNVEVNNGQVNFKVPAASFITLVCN